MFTCLAAEGHLELAEGVAELGLTGPDEFVTFLTVQDEIELWN